MVTSSLESIYKADGAVFTDRSGHKIVSHFGNFHKEIEVLQSNAGLLDMSYCDRLNVTGDDALDLLNRLSTNQLEGMDIGSVRWTILTTPKGRIIDVLRVARMEDYLSVGASPERIQNIMEWIDFYTFGEDVQLVDVSQNTVEFSLIGPNAPLVLGKFVTGGKVLPNDTCDSVQIGDTSIAVIRSDMKDYPRINVICQSNVAIDIRQSLFEAGKDFHLMAVGFQAEDFLRITLGIPIYGFELDDKVDPLTAGLLGYVNFEKGCYVGQEVVTRLNTYQKIKKKLMMIQLRDEVNLGAEIYSDNTLIGEITSVAPGEQGQWNSLAYVKKTYAIPGLVCTVGSESLVEARIVAECSIKV